MNTYGLNQKLATQLLDMDHSAIFEGIVHKTRMPPSFVAATLTETFKDLGRQGIDVNLLSARSIEDVFICVDSGVVAKEAIPMIIGWMVDMKARRLIRPLWSWILA